jgi:hypothetical protein
VPWWNRDLSEKKKRVRRLFNAAKKSGDWTDYKRSLTKYNKALRLAKRDSWKRHCEEIEKAPESARLHRNLSKGGQSAIGSIQLDSGHYTTSEKETLQELLRVHFPGSEIIPEHLGGWDGLELESPYWRGARVDWIVSKNVISCDRLKWAVFSFQPYKSPVMDGILPIMLQRGFELLGRKLLLLLRASLALVYILMCWRHVRLVFIPKPGNPLSQAKSLRLISLMSFVLKTLEKLLGRNIRGGVLVENQFAYRAGMSTETALFHVVNRLQKSLNHREITLGAFLDIEGPFDNTSFQATVEAAGERGLEGTCFKWIGPMLHSRLVHMSIMCRGLTENSLEDVRRGGFIPLPWNLVVDRLLAILNGQDFQTYGYADDIVIIVHGKFPHTVREH